jgi:type II secretory pathway pseudopilin PulG
MVVHQIKKMRQTGMNMKHQNNKGFSLVEMLLTVMLVTGLLVAIFNVLEEYAEKELATSTAKYMDSIALAVQDILNNPLHFQDVYALADASPANTLELSIQDVAAGFDTIPASTRLNGNIRNRTPIGSPITILIRLADDPTDTTDIEALEIIVATTERLLDERVRRVATIAGPYGGFMREEGEFIRSAFASWSIDPLLLAGTSWGDSVVANPPSLEDGIYLVNYRHASFDDIAGDYMFRVRIPGRPEFNRMYTDLNMGTHNILGTDNFNLNNNLSLDGRALINGQMRVTGDTNLQQGDIIAGERFITNNMVVQGLGGGTTGQLIVDDSLNIGTVNLSGQLNAATANFRSDFASGGQISSDNTILQSGISSAGTVNATSLAGASNLSVNVAGSLNASNMQAADLSVQSGRTGVIDMVATGNMSSVNGVSGANMGFQQTNVTTFGTCNEGC